MKLQQHTVVLALGIILLPLAHTRSFVASRASIPIRLLRRTQLVRGGAVEESSAVPNVQQVPLEQAAATATTNYNEATVTAANDTMDEEQIIPERILRYDQASELRLQGKLLHDNGDWYEAAQLFAQAADLLHELEEYQDDQATCQLHHALCLLKCEHYDDCVDVCTELLEYNQSGAMRARALHRRSKAYLGLDRPEEAMQDARSAAFLGDRKAVALYGKLMREHGTGTDAVAEHFGGSPAILQNIMAGKNPFESAANPLFESMLNKSPLSTSDSTSTYANPMASLLSGQGGGLAKSVLSNLTKKLETESDTICKYLNSASKVQLQSLAAMGGVPLSDQHASTIVSFCHKITPKRIQWTVKTSKRLWYVATILRKAIQLVQKYKFIFVAWFVVVWIQASIVRPVPINTKAAIQAAKAAAKASMG